MYQRDLDETGARILDAAMAQFLEHGLRRTTVDDVARRAGLSRITVYRRFARRSDLVREVVVRELDRFAAEITTSVVKVASIEDQMVDAFVLGLRMLRTHPLFNRLMSTEPDEMLPYFTTRGGPFLAAARSLLAGQMRWRGSRLPRNDVEPVAELLLRLAVSFALIPDSCLPLDDDVKARKVVRRYLGPLLRPG